ncbi:hypothetical protein DYQ86_27250 [Acidobacteria bacterium AB60]|nr:hypothetical protein DYQ86_27250 [Acidobacteria bacterium AB60]
MRTTSIALAALTLALATTFGSGSQARAAEPAGAQWNMPWDQPPSEFKEMERKGFHDGVQGAMKDYDHHRFPDVERRSEYKHPHVDASVREDYRKGYRRGYDDAMKHLMASNGRHS